MQGLRVSRTPLGGTNGHHVVSVPGGGGGMGGGFGALPPAPAVVVKNGLKAYGNRPPVISNFNMTVPRGTIYGLLGSSGCGKTTILSCIVGLRQLNSGQVLVCGAKPGTRESGIPGPLVGYMPQEIAMYQFMSIKEILEYYGRIYGLTREETHKRTEYLINLLDLPEAKRVIGTLSGGQQRRCSLAVSLVHQPQLLILDEPTVGVDPIVREKIWDHLINLVKTKKTSVIVTTHYIEEARASATVGLMRNGRLLVEKDPNALLKEYNADLLEDIVLTLCRNDEGLTLLKDLEDAEKDQKDKDDAKSKEGKDEVTQALEEISFYRSNNASLTVGARSKPASGSIAGDKSPIVGLKFKRRHTEENMAVGSTAPGGRRSSVVDIVHDVTEEYVYSATNRITALIIRNYITFFRNIVFMIVVLFIPTVQLIIINTVVGKDVRFMKFGMVNHELPPDSDNVAVTMMSSNNSYSGKSLDFACPWEKEGCLRSGAGCRFVSTFPEDTIIFNKYESEAEALAEVESGNIWGYMSIPPNYTKYLSQRGAYRNYVDNETIDGSEVAFKMDMSQFLSASLLTKAIVETYQTFIRDVVTDCGEINPELAALPIKLRRPIYGEEDQGYQEFIAPGILLIILFFVPLATSGISYIGDKKSGTLDRSMVAGVTTFDILVAFIVTEGSLMIFQIITVSLVMIFWFELVIQGSLFLFFLLTLVNGITGLSLGFLIAVLVDEEMESVMLSIGMYAPLLVLSGLIWPLEGVPTVVQAIAYALPTTYPAEAIRSIVSRGWGFTHSHVWPGFAVMTTWLIVIWLSIALTHKMKKG